MTRKLNGSRPRSLWSQVPKETRDALRAHVFERDGHECQIRAPGCNGRAEDLDHIVPVIVDPTRMLDPDNCRASCEPCNRGHRSSRTAPPSREW